MITSGIEVRTTRLQAEQKHFIILNRNTSYYLREPGTTNFRKRHKTSATYAET